ncbi:hypothetical protein [Kiloniella litopenaei]|uniref:hypothetical protein n=1 Tax=Kiloniella litopenaei TaxID=1549748 RepID=UPI0006977B15|nr:hypothetical protein [Kiloniella litopenaei]
MQNNPAEKTLKLRLYGTFSAEWSDGAKLNVRSTKLRAMIALLAMAPDMTRTRSWLQDKLWSLSGAELGRASLRRGLSDLKRAIGADFETLFDVCHDNIALNENVVELVGTPAEGEFLEGIEIAEGGFTSWVNEQRSNRPQLSSTLEFFNPSDKTGILPAVAVLPFLQSFKRDGENVLGDMLAEEVSRALSRSQLIDVISHLSCRNLNMRLLNLADVRRALNVEYVIHGSYRLSGEHFHLDADFLDAESGRIIWSRQFSARMSDFLNGGQEIVADISRQIGQSILSTSIELATSKPLPEVASHALLVSGVALMHRLKLASFAKARPLIEEIIRKSPNHASLYAWLGKWYVLSVQQGWSNDLKKDSQIASDCTAKALDLDPDNSFSLAVDGLVQNNLLKQFDTAFSRFDRAVELNPNDALAWLLKGTLHAFMDEGDKAVSFTERARSLSPLDPYKYYFDALHSTALLSNGQYQEALSLAELSLKANKSHTSTLRAKIVAQHSLGQQKEAKCTAAELMKLEPHLTISGYLKKHPAAAFGTGQEWAKALKASGVPEL